MCVSVCVCVCVCGVCVLVCLFVCLLVSRRRGLVVFDYSWLLCEIMTPPPSLLPLHLSVLLSLILTHTLKCSVRPPTYACTSDHAGWSLHEKLAGLESEACTPSHPVANLRLPALGRRVTCTFAYSPRCAEGEGIDLYVSGNFIAGICLFYYVCLFVCLFVSHRPLA